MNRNDEPVFVPANVEYRYCPSALYFNAVGVRKHIACMLKAHPFGVDSCLEPASQGRIGIRVLSSICLNRAWLDDPHGLLLYVIYRMKARNRLLAVILVSILFSAFGAAS